MRCCERLERFRQTHLSVLLLFRFAPFIPLLCSFIHHEYSFPPPPPPPDAAGRATVTFGINLTFYNLSSQSFYGSTWTGTSAGEEIDSLSELNRVEDVEFNDVIYFHSRVRDSKCTCIAEITMSIAVNGVVKKSYGIGWC